jgi:protein arginine phosphatase
MRILFVCTGNTCRSPMAEALFAQKKGKHDEVKSAGLYASPGSAASPQSIAVLKEKGISINHRSKMVTEELISWADLILTMTENHKFAIQKQFPTSVNKVYTLKEYVSEESNEIIGELQEVYAELELKRATFIKNNKDQGGNMEAKLRAQLQEEIERITELERHLPNFDISDPFGGTVEIYQRTLNEIDEMVDLLNEKLEK